MKIKVLGAAEKLVEDITSSENSEEFMFSIEPVKFIIKQLHPNEMQVFFDDKSMKAVIDCLIDEYKRLLRELQEYRKTI